MVVQRNITWKRSSRRTGSSSKIDRNSIFTSSWPERSIQECQRILWILQAATRLNWKFNRTTVCQIRRDNEPASHEERTKMVERQWYMLCMIPFLSFLIFYLQLSVAFVHSTTSCRTAFEIFNVAVRGNLRPAKTAICDAHSMGCSTSFLSACSEEYI